MEAEIPKALIDPLRQIIVLVLRREIALDEVYVLRLVVPIASQPSKNVNQRCSKMKCPEREDPSSLVDAIKVLSHRVLERRQARVGVFGSHDPQSAKCRSGHGAGRADRM